MAHLKRGFVGRNQRLSSLKENTLQVPSVKKDLFETSPISHKAPHDNYQQDPTHRQVKVLLPDSRQITVSIPALKKKQQQRTQIRYNPYARPTTSQGHYDVYHRGAPMVGGFGNGRRQLRGSRPTSGQRSLNRSRPSSHHRKPQSS